MYTRQEMQEVIVVDGVAKGIVTRDMVTGKIESYAADAVVLGTGGYGNVFYLSTNAKGCNTTAIWRAYQKGAAFANPCFTQIHPTCIPVTGDHQSKLTLMTESLRNDGRIWVPLKQGDKRAPGDIPEKERDYYLERKYPSYGNLAPRDIASVPPSKSATKAGAWATPAWRLSGFHRRHQASWPKHDPDRYGNLFEMYERITGENPYQVPMRIYPAIHYTMGGLWVDYNLMSTVPGLFVNRARRTSPTTAPIAWGARADAGLGGRLLRLARHHYLATWSDQARQLEQPDHPAAKPRGGRPVPQQTHFDRQRQGDLHRDSIARWAG